MLDEAFNEMMAKALASARKEADAELFKHETINFASQIHTIYEGLCESGFSPEQAMQIVCTVLRGTMNAN